MSAQVDEETRLTEGAALRFLIKGRGMSQAQLASLTSSIAGGESMLSQRLSGVRPIPLDAGLAYAKALNVSVADFSPRVAVQLRAVLEAVGEHGLQRHVRASLLTSDGGFEHDKDLGATGVALPDGDQKDKKFFHGHKRLAKARARLFVSQQAAADFFGVSRVTWGQYERGKATPNADVLAGMAQMGADVYYILTGERFIPPPPEPVIPLHALALLSNWRAASDEGRRTIEAVAEAVAKTRTGRRKGKNRGNDPTGSPHGLPPASLL